MSLDSPISSHRDQTRELARGLAWRDIYNWLLSSGYYPESYVLPPCFTVTKKPARPTLFYQILNNGKKYRVDRHECVNVHFPKSDLTDRTFGIIHPQIHNDIAYHISRNWGVIVDAMFPCDSKVSSYSFPIPIDATNPGRVGFLRSGRMIYEFLNMTEDDLAAVAYRFAHVVKADIKSFYPSIYTHSIAWAIHGKKMIRQPANLHNYLHVGNRLDKLFQNANDGCTNGIPIGPVVSDIVSEIVASAVDRLFCREMAKMAIEYEAVRFKDDYRILVKTSEDGKAAIKALQKSLKEYNLELSDEKTQISSLPNGLFRQWVSKYHAAYPRKLRSFSWKQFRELYLCVIAIDKEYPSTGVIDRFLADITKKDGVPRIRIDNSNLEKVISMLLMLATLRVKAFPKVIAIIELLVRSRYGQQHKKQILEYLEAYLQRLVPDEERNKYLIAWIGYFLVSNDLIKHLKTKPKLSDIVTRSIFSNRPEIYKDCKEFKLFEGSRSVAKRMSIFEYLDVFDPPRTA
jgi:hypothetical protein